VQAPVLLPELEAALAHADSPPATEGRQRTLAAHHFAPARLDQAAHGAGNGVAGEAREAVSPGAVSARGFKLLRLQRLPQRCILFPSAMAEQQVVRGETLIAKLRTQPRRLPQLAQQIGS